MKDSWRNGLLKMQTPEIQEKRLAAMRIGKRLKMMSPEKRLFRKVEKTESCWNYRGRLNVWGYGTMAAEVRGKWRTVLAHRFSWELHLGKIPQGMFVCHHCDNPACVRPEHLFLGTHVDNMQDMVYKNRKPELQKRKLTRDQVMEIRKRWSLGERKSLKAEFKIGETPLRRVALGLTYREIK